VVAVSFLKYAPRIKLSLQTSLPHVRTVIRSFGPVVVSRGVVQLSGYVDQIIASWLGTAAVAGLSYAQTIYFLPISLFGMSVAAAELPQMSGATGTEEEINIALRTRLERGLRQIAFFVVPTVAAFIFIGRLLVAALFQSGQFHSDDTLYVWYILIGSTFGLLAATLGRLYSSAFYALRDPKTPLRFAMLRVTLTAVLGLLFAFPLRPYIVDLIVLLHMPVPNLPEGSKLLGVIGLTASAGMAAWIEFAMLRRALARRVGRVKLAPSFLGRLWISGLTAAIAGVACHLYLAPLIVPHLPFRHISEAILVSGAFGLVYFTAAILLGINEARATLRRFTRR
jgi:putative peptidoglycan lipid II flippase